MLTAAGYGGVLLCLFAGDFVALKLAPSRNDPESGKATGISWKIIALFILIQIAIVSGVYVYHHH